MQIDVLGERYQIQDPIGRGGMATIYRARDMRTDRIVAVKLLREAYSTDPKFVTRFQREAKAASSLHHPNIVQVYDYGQSEGNYFIVMEYIEGTDLRRYLRSRGILAVDRAVIIAHDVALGLGAAHRRQIVHRDVKPQNILVGRDGSIKLTDFGIASVYKDINDERLTTTGMTLGTVQYYAPEQAQGEIVNPAADVYALGIVMYEMLAGRTPFDGDTPVAVAMQHIQDMPKPPSQLNPNLPPVLEEIIMRCLEKIPEMRYRDGSSLARAIELLDQGDVGGAKLVPPSSGGPSVPPANGISKRRDSLAGVENDYSGAMSNPSPHQPMTSSPNDRLGRPYSPPPNNVVSPAQDFRAVLEPNVANNLGAGGYPQPSPDATLKMDEPTISYNMPVDSEATRPFAKGDIIGQKESEGSRVVNVVIIVILLATLLLLGFSVYLASQLGFFPGPQSSSVTPTSQHTPSELKIPELSGKTLTEAQQMLKNAGIQLTQVQVEADPNDPRDLNMGENVVTHTDPPVGKTLQAGKMIILYVTNYNLLTATPSAQNTSSPPSTSKPLPAVTPTPVPTAKPTPTPAATPTVEPTSRPRLTPTPTPPPPPTSTPPPQGT